MRSKAAPQPTRARAQSPSPTPPDALGRAASGFETSDAQTAMLLQAEVPPMPSAPAAPAFAAAAGAAAAKRGRDQDFADLSKRATATHETFNERDLKRIRRKQKNRESAQRSRQRKADETAALASTVHARDSELADWRAAAKALHANVQLLAAQVTRLGGRVDPALLAVPLPEQRADSDRAGGDSAGATGAAAASGPAHSGPSSSSPQPSAQPPRDAAAAPPHLASQRELAEAVLAALRMPVAAPAAPAPPSHNSTATAATLQHRTELVAALTAAQGRSPSPTRSPSARGAPSTASSRSTAASEVLAAALQALQPPLHKAAQLHADAPALGSQSDLRRVIAAVTSRNNSGAQPVRHGAADASARGAATDELSPAAAAATLMAAAASHAAAADAWHMQRGTAPLGGSPEHA